MSSHAGGQFRVVSRPVVRTVIPDAPLGPDDPPERFLGTHPMRSFVDVSDGTAGLALSTKGIYEYEVIPGESRAGRDTADTGVSGNTGGASDLALTLMRCVGWLSTPDLRMRKGNAGPRVETPDAQCLGRWEFEYSLYPHKGNWLEGGVHLFADSYQSAPVCFRPAASVAGDRAAASGVAAGDGVASSAVAAVGCAGGAIGEVSFLSVDRPELMWSSVRSAPYGALLVRLYNVSPCGGKALLKSLLPVKTAAKVDLRNVPTGEPVALKDENAVEFDYRGLEIVTLRLVTG